MRQSTPHINPPSQSWSSYILSTYSSSVSPTHDPDQYAPSATPISSPTSSTPPNPTSSSSPLSTSASPWGPYLKSGRGGAGNFTWQSSHSAPASTNPDPESGRIGLQQSSLTSRQKAAAETEAREQADALANQHRPEYTHMGRGGAGNFTPSAEVAPPASALEAAPPPIPVPTSASGVDPYLAARSGYYGRGGAGNYNSSSEAAEKLRREEEEREREREEGVRRRVEESVQAEMRRPEGAVMREGRERGYRRMV